MKNIYKDSWKVLKLHSLLTVPFILYLYFISISMTRSQSAPSKSIFLVFIFTGFLLTVCFFAGWFYMAKNAVENYNQIKENGINPQKDYAFDNLKLFFSGVGEYFIPVAFALFLYIIILSLFLYGIYLTGNHLIGGFPITYSQLKLISTNPVEANNIISTLNQSQLMQLSAWSFLFMSSYLFYSYSTMFYYPALFYRTKNCFKAFFESFIFTFRNIKLTLVLFLFYILSKTILSVINSIFTSNFLLSTASLLIIVYFAAYWIKILFYTYEQKENYSIDRSDSFGKK
mgnify:CR=1 FL=1